MGKIGQIVGPLLERVKDFDASAADVTDQQGKVVLKKQLKRGQMAEVFANLSARGTRQVGGPLGGRHYRGPGGPAGSRAEAPRGDRRRLRSSSTNVLG